MDLKTKAKAVKIERIFPGEVKPFGGILRGKCPIHKDSGTPNFTIYPKTNSWFCFRCGFGGDSIAFWMRWKDVDFKTAIKELAKIK